LISRRVDEAGSCVPPGPCSGGSRASGCRRRRRRHGTAMGGEEATMGMQQPAAATIRSPQRPAPASASQRKPASGRQERHDVRSAGGVAWCDGRSSGAAVGGEPRTGKAAISPCLRLAPSRCRRHQGSEPVRAIRLVGSASSPSACLPLLSSHIGFRIIRGPPTPQQITTTTRPPSVARCTLHLHFVRLC
jgi:hypothetical protein